MQKRLPVTSLSYSKQISITIYHLLSHNNTGVHSPYCEKRLENEITFVVPEWIGNLATWPFKLSVVAAW